MRNLAAAYLVYKDHPWNNLRDTLVDVGLDNLVDFTSQFFGDFRPPAPFDKATHNTHNVLPTLWSGIRRVKIAQSNILN